MTSSIEQLDAARGWTAQLKSVQDAATKLAAVTEQADRAQAAAVLPSVVTDAGTIAGAIKMASGSVSDVAATKIASGWVSDAGSIQGLIPDATKMISGSIPDTIKMASGAIPDADSPIYAALPKVTPIATGTVHDWSGGAVKVPGDFTSVTSGLSLDEIQRVSAAFAATGVAQRSPAYGGTFRLPSAPVSPRRQRGTNLPPTARPASPRRRESVEDEQQTPRVLPQEMGEALAQNLIRGHRQEAKGLLVALDLDLELEHLESIERRLLDGGRPDRLQAALSASHLLKGLADKLFPPTEERWVCRFGKTYKLARQTSRIASTRSRIASSSSAQPPSTNSSSLSLTLYPVGQARGTTSFSRPGKTRKPSPLCSRSWRSFPALTVFPKKRTRLVNGRVVWSSLPLGSPG